jgi:hypothetical protein
MNLAKKPPVYRFRTTRGLVGMRDLWRLAAHVADYAGLKLDVQGVNRSTHNALGTFLSFDANALAGPPGPTGAPGSSGWKVLNLVSEQIPGQSLWLISLTCGYQRGNTPQA